MRIDRTLPNTCWFHPRFAKLSVHAQKLYLLLLTTWLSNEEGRFYDSHLEGLWPRGDRTPRRVIRKALDELHEAGMVSASESGLQTYSETHRFVYPWRRWSK